MVEPASIRQEILRLTREAPRPLSFRELRRAYAGPRIAEDEFRRILHVCVAAGAVFPCASHRYWHRDEEEMLTERARELIARRPRNRAELVRALGELGTGAPESVRGQVFDALRDGEGFYLHPVLGNPRSYRLSTSPPELEDYVDRARLEYRRVVDTLSGAGFAEEEIARAVCGLALSKAGQNGSEPHRLGAPEDEGGLDFQRDASELLAYAWSDAESPEARELIEDTLYSLGLDPVGKAGEVTDFDGRLQHLDAKLQPGERVQVIQPGWELRNARGAHLILKARVRPYSAN